MIWLASWPRSGNTFLRTILWNCFAMKSGSVYPNDLGGDRNLTRVIGHVEHDEIGKGAFHPGRQGIQVIASLQTENQVTATEFIG